MVAVVGVCGVSGGWLVVGGLVSRLGAQCEYMERDFGRRGV